MKVIAVLVVEDLVFAADLNIRHIQRAGYETKYLIISHRDEMIRAMEEQEWDLIVSDHSLPAFCSLEALDIRNQFDRDIPFIIVTENISEVDKQIAMDKGCNGIISKNAISEIRKLVVALLE